MADNSKKTCKPINSKNKSKHFRYQKPGKKKSTNKRKNNYFFKRKRLIRYLILRKKNLKMDNDPTSTVAQSSNRWQQEDETAFWKARAVSLEHENKMLHKHIKGMYITMINRNQQITPNQDYQEYEEIIEDIYEEESFALNKNKENKLKNKEMLEDEEQSKPPTNQNSKKREEEMKILYGSAWRIIMGMETAVQLNYDLNNEKNKPQYWPIVPIKI